MRDFNIIEIPLSYDKTGSQSAEGQVRVNDREYKIMFFMSADPNYGLIWVYKIIVYKEFLFILIKSVFFP